MKAKIIRLILYIRSCPRNIVILLKNRRYWNKNESYFPDVAHKSNLKILFEQLCCVLRHGEINDFYFLYGFDAKTHKECKGYIQHCDFRHKRTVKNSKPFNELCILRDKEYFSIFGQAYNLPVLKTVGIFENGMIYSNTGKEDILSYLFSSVCHSLFFKPLNDECGAGIFSLNKKNNKWIINDKDEYDEHSINVFFLNLKKQKYIVQSRLEQCEDMNRLYPNSINTIRIITIRDKEGVPQFFHSLLRIGAGGNVVDNWAKGGIVVGIDKDGFLGKWGYFKPQYGKKTIHHPDTNVVFEGFRIPYYNEAIDVCLSYHQRLKNVYAIGWDVAITEDGPILIEGNDNFEISLHQAVDRGLKKEICWLLK